MRGASLPQHPAAWSAELDLRQVRATSGLFCCVEEEEEMHCVCMVSLSFRLLGAACAVFRPLPKPQRSMRSAQCATPYF